MNSPALSVIVPTFNRANLLDECLESLCQQDLDDASFEIIVVDNNSRDRTPALVAEYAAKKKNLSYVKEEKQGVANARNRGCAEARGEYLCYTDDDVVFPHEYLTTVQRIIRDYAPDFLGGPVYPRYGSNKPRWFKDDYISRKRHEVSGFSTTCRITGVNYIVKKSIVQELGGFDPRLGPLGSRVRLGEEGHFLDTYRQRTAIEQQKVYYAVELYVYHQARADKVRVSYQFKRGYAEGRALIRAQSYTNDMRLSAVVKMIRQSSSRSLCQLRQEIKAQGLGGANYVHAARTLFTVSGMLIEGIDRKIHGRWTQPGTSME